jgi:hypothetical protein
MASAGIRKTPTGRYRVWWRRDDAGQGSQTFDTRHQARDFKHDLLARLAPRELVDRRLSKQQFETWAREWWDSWAADPDHSPRTLQAAEARLRRHLLPTVGKRQLRAITVSVVRQWQNDLRGKVGCDTVMAYRLMLYRILQAAEDDRRIEANPAPRQSHPSTRPSFSVVLSAAHTRRRNSATCSPAPRSPRWSVDACGRAGAGLRGTGRPPRTGPPAAAGLGAHVGGSVVTGRPRAAATPPPWGVAADPGHLRHPPPAGHTLSLDAWSGRRTSKP